MIRQYCCVKWVPTDACNARAQVDRVLGLERSTGRIALIAMGISNAKIRILNQSSLEAALSEGKAAIVDLHPPRKKLTKATEAYREETWKDLEPFRLSNQSYLFNCHARASLVKVAMKKSGKKEPTIRMSLRRYLQGGSTREGIECHFGQCGIPGEVGRAIEAGKKRGRKKLFHDFRRPCSETPVSEEDQAIFDRVIKDHLMGLNNRHVSYRFVYDARLTNYFNTGIGNGDATKRMIPSFAQFKYYIQSRGWSSKIKESRKTATARGTSGRSKNSENTSLEPQGPGDVYQIDSTQADIFLVVSETNRRFIGKATVYLVVDVFSRMIVGVHVTLGAPCYEEAAIALVSVLEDKVALCARHGIQISAEDWPNTPLPSTLVADRQEFIWGNSNLLSDRLRITIVNTPKYRGDFKGMVESHIGRAMKVTWTFPGAHDPDASKDEPSTKTDAVLTLSEFTKLILIDIIKANGRHEPSISLPREAAQTDVRKTPKDVARWGLENISGLGKAGNLDFVRRALLPLTSYSRSTPEGIRVSAGKVTGIFFDDAGKKLPPFLFEPGNGTDLVTQYDPRTMDYVYVEHPDTKEILVAELSKKRSKEYRGSTWAEGADFQLRQKEIEARNEIPDAAKGQELNDAIDETLQNAVTRARNQPKSSFSAMVSDEKGQRKLARAHELLQRPPLPAPQLAFDDSYEG